MDRIIGDSPRIQQWMHAKSGLPIMEEFHGVAREVNGEIVAAFGYDHFQPETCSMHICVSDKRALNRSLLRVAFRVPFEQWRYSCLLSMIRADNAESLRIAAHFGFEELARVPGVLHFGILYPKNCRWLSPTEA